MPKLPLPQQAETAILGSALVVSSDEDVRNVWPGFIRDTDSAPVRDGLVAAQAAILRQYQEQSAYAAAQTNILYATGIYLEGLCEDLGVYKQAGEGDEDLRTRALQTPKLVTPAAIVAAADAILSPYTTTRSQYAEALDGWFVRRGKNPDGSSTPRSWLSFVFRGTGTGAPDYPDRLYEDHKVTNDGYFRPQSDPGGARIFPCHRSFLLRVPDLRGLDLSGAFAYEGGASSPYRMFLGRGTSSVNASFFRQRPTTALRLYQAIASTIDRIKAMGVVWLLNVDPKLKA